MEFKFNHSMPINADFQKNFQGASQHLFTKVVLIDRREAEAEEKVYQLSPEFLVNPENLRPLKERFLMGHYEGVFLPLGIIEELNRSKKQLRLKNGNVVSYEHLIQLMGGNEEESEFIGALEALIDALLVSGHKSVLHALKKLASPIEGSIKYDPKILPLGENANTFNPKKLAKDSFKGTDLPLDKRFYEFQL